MREPAFRLIPGSQIQHPPEARAVDYFDFFDDNVWQRMVVETNHYAEQQRAANSPPRWDLVTVPVLKAFVGLTLSMGILHLPHRQNYWRKTKWVYETRFSQVMSRDRFDCIWRYFHLQDNTVQPAESDPLWKLRWYIDHLVKNFKDTYIPNEHVTVDESMVKFKGRLAFRQYLPSKPTKWGVKVWSLCESSTGYTWNFQVYLELPGIHRPCCWPTRAWPVIPCCHAADRRPAGQLHEGHDGQFINRVRAAGSTACPWSACLRDCTRKPQGSASKLAPTEHTAAERRVLPGTERRPDVFGLDGHKASAHLVGSSWHGRSTQCTGSTWPHRCTEGTGGLPDPHEGSGPV